MNSVSFFFFLLWKENELNSPHDLEIGIIVIISVYCEHAFFSKPSISEHLLIKEEDRR